MKKTGGSFLFFLLIIRKYLKGNSRININQRLTRVSNGCQSLLRICSGHILISFVFIFFLTLFVITNYAIADVDKVEIPIRVFYKGVFVDNLNLNDFEVYEDGMLQKVNSLSLIKGINILKQEGASPDSIVTHRNYWLMFQATEWDNKIAEAIDYLFKSVLQSGDTMTLITPMKAYSLSPEAMANKSDEDLAKEMQKIVRKDIQIGNSDYRATLNSLRRIVQSIGGETNKTEADMETDGVGSQFGLEMQIERYKQSLLKLESLRLVDEKKLLDFASSLRAVPGKNFVFFFYQREFRPEINPSVLNTMMSLYQEQPNILNDLQDLFNLYKRDSTINAVDLERAFADSGVNFNFIFMNKESMYMFGAIMREQSEDVFDIFSKIAKATGGRALMTQNPAVSFQAAADFSEKYYLLSYSPTAETAKESSFRKIEVKLKKGPGYEIYHQVGYYYR